MRLEEYSQAMQEVSLENALNDPLLFNLLEKKVVDRVKRRYHVLLEKGIERRWLSGEHVVEIAEEEGLPPVVVGKMIRKKLGRLPRLEKEIEEAEGRDFFYSRAAVERAAANGRMAEERVAEWLSRKGIEFVRGDRLKGSLHPDFLFKSAVEIGGRSLRWLECKYYFGSPEDMRRAWRGQLEKYRRAFGPGGIVYWLGFVEDAVPGEEHAVFSGEFFQTE